MKRFLLAPVLLLASSGARLTLAAPAPSAKPAALALPPQVRAQMTPGAKSLRLIQLPAAGSAATLVHLWSASRGSGTQPDAGPSLFCVDVFEPGSGANQWKLKMSQSFVSYGNYGASPGAPVEASARWLTPSRREGVVVLAKFSDPGGDNYMVITFPDDVAPWFEVTPSVVQEFRVGGPGGGSTSSLSLGTDAQGTTTVVVKIVPHSSHPPEFLIGHWNGYRFNLPSNKR